MPEAQPHKKQRLRPVDAYRLRDDLDADTAPIPTGPTAAVYRIAGYQQNLIGDSAKPACLVIAAKWGSGLKWPDPNNPQPTDLLWGGGVTAGLWWDGTVYRDLARYPAGGPLHWCSYFKPGTGPGPQNGYWINFGCAYSHLAHDDPAQLLTGAAQRLYYDSATAQWMLVIQATDYITNAVRDVWTGSKAGGPDPVGPYTRVTGCDPLATVTVAAG